MNIQDKVLKDIDSDAFINNELVERVDAIVDESLLDESYKIGSVDEQEERHI